MGRHQTLPETGATDRGRRSFDFLMRSARSKLLARAPAEVVVPFDGRRPLAGTTRPMTDDRIPGGSASGKVIAYVLRASGDGERRAEVRISCTIGNGAAQSATGCTPACVDDGYAEPGWQLRTSETSMVIAGEVAYGDLSGVPMVDDGTDSFGLEPGDVIQAFDGVNGETAQTAVLDQRFGDIPTAVEALNSSLTEVVLDLKPLTGGPFETSYLLAVTPLAVPRTLTL